MMKTTKWIELKMFIMPLLCRIIAQFIANQLMLQ